MTTLNSLNSIEWGPTSPLASTREEQKTRDLENKTNSLATSNLTRNYASPIKPDRKDHQKGILLYSKVKNGSLDDALKLMKKGATLTLKDIKKRNILHVLALRKDLTVDQIQPFLDQIPENIRKMLINKQDDSGNTPLLLAIKEGHIEVAKMFIYYKANVNKGENLKNNTPLMLAVKKGYLELALLLIESNAKCWNIKDKKGKDLIYYVAQLYIKSPEDPIIERLTSLIIREYDPFFTISDFIKLAVLLDDPNLLKLLYSKTLPNIQGSSDGLSYFLSLAIEEGKTNAAEFLIDFAANREDAEEVLNTEREYPIYADELSDESPGGITCSPLIAAIFYGQKKIIMQLLNIDAVNIEACDDDEELFPLHMAAYKRNKEAVNKLLERGALIDTVSAEGKTPLHLALEKGNHSIAKLLLQKGARVDIADEKGKTPLHLALEKGYHNIAELLLQNESSVDSTDAERKTPLHLAAQNGHYNIVRLLLQKGARVNIADAERKTSLHLAAQNGHYNIVKLLLQKGARVNIADAEEKTPLQLAAQNGHYKLAKLLLNATIKIKGNEALKIPLILQIEAEKNKIFDSFILEGNCEKVKAFLGEGTCLHKMDRLGRTPLHLAAQNGRYKLAKLFLQKGASVNSTDGERKTPLHLAAQNGHYTIAKLLLQNEASVESTDAERKTPLHLAAQNGHHNIAELLLQNEASVNSTDIERKTPLHLAAQNGHHSIAELLLQKGASVGIVDRNGNAPLHLAAQNGHLETVQTLLSRKAEVTAKNRNEKTPFDLIKESLEEARNIPEISAETKSNLVTILISLFLEEFKNGKLPPNQFMLHFQQVKGIADEVNRREELIQPLLDTIQRNTRSHPNAALIQIIMKDQLKEGKLF